MKFILFCATVFAATISLADAQSLKISTSKGHGKIVHNPNLPDGGSFAYINFARICGSMQSTDAAWPGKLNVNGYFTSSPTAAATCGFNIPQSYSGSWIVRWSGSFGSGGIAGVRILALQGGTYTVNSDPGSCVTDATSGGLKLTKSDCVVEFTPSATTQGFQFQFLASGTGANVNITDIEFYRSDQAALRDAGEIFNPDYVSFLRTLNPAALRMLGWSENNFDYRSRFAYSPPVGTFNINSTQYVPSLWAGAASFSSNAYTVSAPSGWVGLVDGATVHVRIANANSGSNPTLNVSSTGAVTIKYHSQGTVSTGEIGANTFATFVYDIKLNIWMYSSDGFIGVAPWETQIALCNKVSADCWLQAPYLYDEASFQTWGVLVRDTLNSSLDFIAEYGNENGNFSSPIRQWLLQRALAISLPNDGNDQARYEMSGYRNSQMMLGLNAVWTLTGRSASTLKPVITNVRFEEITYIAAYTFGGGNLTFDASGNYCNGSGCTIVTNYSQSPNRPRDLAYYSSMANYIAGGNATYNPNTEWLDPLQAAKTITGITNAATGKVSITSHGWSNGDRVQLTSTPGMSSLSGGWTTVTNAGANDFDLSTDTTDTNGTVIGANSTGFGTFTGTGTASRLTPNVNSGIYTAISDWASGVWQRQTAALQWLSNDFKSGTRLNSSGTPVLGGSTIEWYWNHSGSGLISWVDYYNSIANVFSKPVIAYEGGYENRPVTTATMRKLGKTDADAITWESLTTNWRNSDYMRETTSYMQNKFSGISASLFWWSGWSQDIYTVCGYATGNFQASGTTFTVNSISLGTIYPGQTIQYPGMNAAAVILGQLTGTAGGVGTYQLSASATMSATNDAAVCHATVWANAFGTLYGTMQGSFIGMANFSAAP